MNIITGGGDSEPSGRVFDVLLFVQKTIAIAGRVLVILYPKRQTQML